MKERLDILLVNKGLAPSREKAKAMIMEGNVFVDNNREDKAGSTFDVNANIEVKGNTLKYVSRGGLKLEKATQMMSLLRKLLKSVWTSEPPQVVLRTVCSRTARSKFMLWTWDMVSLRGNCGRMNGLSVWKRQTSVM